MTGWDKIGILCKMKIFSNIIAFSNKNFVKILLTLLMLFILFLAWHYYLRFLPFVPREKITIILPFADEDDDLIFINPMGEKVQHPDSPNGHPGLDFGWNHPASILAAAGELLRE